MNNHCHLQSQLTWLDSAPHGTGSGHVRLPCQVEEVTPIDFTTTTATMVELHVALFATLTIDFFFASDRSHFHSVSMGKVCVGGYRLVLVGYVCIGG